MKSSETTLFLCGDVMTGRGIDQILPYPCSPVLHESCVKNANTYVALAEEENGIIQRPVDFNYIWGDALSIFNSIKPDLKIINLETSITTSENWVNKHINYRMSPQNVPCLESLGVNACVLANNHIVDWGEAGLEETIAVLEQSGIKTVGAGKDLKQAIKPAILNLPKGGRVILFALGSVSSGVPLSWAAEQDKSGVNVITTLDLQTVNQIHEWIVQVKKANDIVIVSLHWGANWGYTIPKEHQEFARGLIDDAEVDIVYGHSSHHFLGFEYYHKKLILYGAGDFMNDYEGITGYEEFKNDIVLMYFPTINVKTGELIKLRIIPLELKKFSLHKVGKETCIWVEELFNRELTQVNSSPLKLQYEQFDGVNGLTLF